MAKVLCDCGCGVTIERNIFANAACKMRYRRGVTISNNTVTKSNEKSLSVTKGNEVQEFLADSPSTSLMVPKATGTENMYGTWINGAWTPKV